MKLCNQTVTLYNAKYDKIADADAYKRTVITGAHWFSTVKSNVDGTGLKAASQITIRIPDDADFDGKSYLKPNVYAAADDVSNSFTLNNGDIVVLGIASEINPSPAALRRAYSDIVTILGVTDNRKAPNAPHWKVVGA